MCVGMLVKFKRMLPDLSSANESLTTSFPFWKKQKNKTNKNYTGSLVRLISTTKLPHFLSGTLRNLSLRTFQNCFTPTNPFELFGPAVKKLLKVPPNNLKYYGKILPFQTAQIWNTLPTAVRNSPSLFSFKKKSENIS